MNSVERLFRTYLTEPFAVFVSVFFNTVITAIDRSIFPTTCFTCLLLDVGIVCRKRLHTERLHVCMFARARICASARLQDCEYANRRVRTSARLQMRESARPHVNSPHARTHVTFHIWTCTRVGMSMSACAHVCASVLLEVCRSSGLWACLC